MDRAPDGYLGATTYRATVREEPAMPSESHTTTDHDEIRRWVEDHDGTPVLVKATESEDGSGVLRIDFPGGAGGDRFDEVEWDQWFQVFDDKDLAFLYQAHKASGEDSTFFKLVRR